MIVDGNAPGGEVIWAPDEATITAANVTAFAEFVRAHGFPAGADYEELWRWSVDDPAAFWELFATYAGVEFGGDTGPVLPDPTMPGARWFPGRTLNFARHLLEGRDGVALLSVDESGATTEMSWEELRRNTAALAATLQDEGVGPGDRVVGVLPNVAESVVGLLATAALGATWSVCAPEFGPGAIVSRFAQLKPTVVLAAPGYRLSGRDRDRRAELAEVLAKLPGVERVIWVTGHTDVEPPEIEGPSCRWEDAIAGEHDLVYTEVGFEHPLWVLFSSGTTGKPKGIVHGHGGALLESLKMLLFHSDLRPGDRYFNVASTSWVLWNTLVASLGVGATAVLLDGNPTYPSVDHVWEVAARTRAAAVGVSAGFVHACAKAELRPSDEHDLSALRCVQVTGSPLSHDGYRWVYAEVGDIWLSSMSGGTDIASVFVGGTPTLPVHVGFIQAPALGVKVESWDAAGRPAEGRGELVVTAPMPSMPLRFWDDPGDKRYRSSYFDTYPGVWRHGDFIEFAPSGILIHGRSDSTLNRNGLRLGSADLYSIVEALPEVLESLVIGAELDDEEYYMPLFVRLADGIDEDRARTAIVAAIRAGLSPRYVPDEIVVMPGIPHTRTGKKLEIPVKRLVQGAALAEVADLGAVDDPELLATYARFAAERAPVRITKEGAQ